MACPPQDITDTELSILEVLWQGSPKTTREIMEVLYPGGATSHYATVQSLLQRLEEKSLVTRDRRQRPHHFGAAVGRDEVLGRRLKNLADTFCQGSLSPLLTHLVRTEKLSREEREELRALLEELDRKTAKRRNRR